MAGIDRHANTPVVQTEFRINQSNPTGTGSVCCLSLIQPAGIQTDSQKMRAEQLLSLTDRL